MTGISYQERFGMQIFRELFGQKNDQTKQIFDWRLQIKHDGF